MSPEQERRIRAAVFPPFIGETSEADVCALLRELDSLRALCQTIRREALEEAAGVCDRLEGGKHADGTPAAGVAWECASAIRALADAPDAGARKEGEG